MTGILRQLSLAVILSTAIGGCSPKPEPVARCEAILLGTLKAPSTYKLIEQTVAHPKADGSQDVFLTYDAANSYNAPIRDRYWCIYNSRTRIAASRPPDPAIVEDDMDIPPVVGIARSESSSPPAGAEAETDVPVCSQEDSPSKFELMNQLGVDCTGE
ncbi:hypothetical protein [Sphingomonas sp. Leaf17]|uniref:hypothetical protein n=1 Tax=Sphingomonas sp. Leaf17 TaxID=1735683 RepID=UPI0012E16DFB|nr:hypothetical protein [Sphingomonas sp. Leaf17]